MNRRSLLSSLVVASTLLIGCGGHTWHVVAMAAPDPFLGQKKFAVLPIDYADLHVGAKSEAQYLGEKDEKQRASFAEDKVALNDKYVEELMVHAREAGVEIVLATGPADAPFMIRPSVAFLEPGFYVGVASAPSHVEMSVKITTPDGKVLDEVLLDHGTNSAGGMSIGGISLNPSSGGRLRKDGEALGKTTARYLKMRVGAGE